MAATFYSLDAIPVPMPAVSKSAKIIETELLKKEQALRDELKQFLSSVKSECNLIEENKAESLASNTKLKKACFYFISSFGTARITLESFVFFSTFFALIPGLPILGYLGLGLLCALISISFYQAFDVHIYKESLNIETKEKNSIALLKVYAEQVKILKELNHLQFAPNSSLKLSQAQKDKIQEYNNIISQLECPNYPVSPMLKAAKYFLLAFGMTAVIGGEYFMMKTLLSALAELFKITAFAGNVLPIILIVVSITWALGAAYLTTGTSIDNLIHPEKEEQTKLEKELSGFKNLYCPI